MGEDRGRKVSRGVVGGSDVVWEEEEQRQRTGGTSDVNWRGRGSGAKRQGLMVLVPRTERVRVPLAGVGVGGLVVQVPRSRSVSGGG